MAHQDSSVSTVHKGKTYTARIIVEPRTVTVRCQYGEDTTQIGASVEVTAKMLLGEIIRKADAEGRL